METISHGSGMVGMLGHVGTYLAAESTASKLPSNGVPEMKADRVLKGLACQDLLAFYFPTLCLARHHVTRPGRRERGAGVSRSECEQCGLVRGGELGEQGISRPCTVCRSRLLSAAAGPRCLPAAKVTPDTPAMGASADLSHFGKLLEDMLQWRSARLDCRGIYWLCFGPPD